MPFSATDSRPALPALISAGFVVAAGMLILPFQEMGPLSVQMALHIAVMNVIAPLAAPFVMRAFPDALHRPGMLALAGIAQMALLWGWHLPAVQHASAASPALHVGLFALLGMTALVFWGLLLSLHARARWRGVGALLITGKLACLLGGLMVFAPHDVYALPAINFLLCTTGPSTAADQHLAGLLMLVACPLSYVLAGVVVAGQMLGDLERRDGLRGPFAAH
ncbi:cytochrome c oxidase assembly protein [Terrihabitans sp. B22-R8]|uniref:cytochrome c oxidase assembly protein n=1 Tax=Terrihabitans sp. B22-R8 TaxID=3425128 RepID=UPI00403CFBF3